MERHTPQLVADWRVVTSDERRRAIAVLIVRVATSRYDQPELATNASEPMNRILLDIEPRLLDDPDWMALAVTMTRAAATGFDVAAHLPELAREPALPLRHPARELHWRLLDACPAASLVELRDAAVHSPSVSPPIPHSSRGASL
jgi:hypothetical protein